MLCYVTAMQLMEGSLTLLVIPHIKKQLLIHRLSIIICIVMQLATKTGNYSICFEGRIRTVGGIERIHLVILVIQ